MTELKPIDVQTAATKLNAGEITLIDIREKDEFARERISAAVSIPISTLDKSGLTLEANKPAIFHCKSGMRTQSNCARIEQHIDGEAYILTGGLDAWKAAGFPTIKDATQPLEINRQVQITAGLLILTGIALGSLVDPRLYAISAFIGAGLTFAGLSGWCGLATLLSAMPWNKTRTLPQ